MGFKGRFQLVIVCDDVFLNSARPKLCRSDSGLDFALSIANDIMDIDFESAADVDIGSLDDDLDFFSTDKIVAPQAANGSADQWTFGQV